MAGGPTRPRRPVAFASSRALGAGELLVPPWTGTPKSATTLALTRSIADSVPVP
jgi:hypothetical protein